MVSSPTEVVSDRMTDNLEHGGLGLGLGGLTRDLKATDRQIEVVAFRIGRAGFRIGTIGGTFFGSDNLPLLQPFGDNIAVIDLEAEMIETRRLAFRPLRQQ